jgi:hypothetical protein
MRGSRPTTARICTDCHPCSPVTDRAPEPIERLRSAWLSGVGLGVIETLAKRLISLIRAAHRVFDLSRTIRVALLNDDAEHMVP